VQYYGLKKLKFLSFGNEVLTGCTTSWGCWRQWRRKWAERTSSTDQCRRTSRQSPDPSLRRCCRLL